jgi:hypothetical protein
VCRGFHNQLTSNHLQLASGKPYVKTESSPGPWQLL